MAANTTIFTALIYSELARDVDCLAAYNTMAKKGPSNTSAILREAIHAFVKHLGYKLGKTDILETPPPTYIKKLSQIRLVEHPKECIKKGLNISQEDYDVLEEIAAYNKYHGLKPKNVSKTCCAALTLYIDSIDYEFRPR